MIATLRPQRTYDHRLKNLVYETGDIQHATERGVHPAALAVVWVLSHPAVTAPIIGARTVAQLETLLGALDIDMTPEWRNEISELSVEPPLATDRREEQLGFFYKDWRP